MDSKASQFNKQSLQDRSEETEADSLSNLSLGSQTCDDAFDPLANQPSQPSHFRESAKLVKPANRTRRRTINPLKPKASFVLPFAGSFLKLLSGMGAPSPLLGQADDLPPALWLTPTFWFPLTAAILFAFAAVLMKRTSQWKIDIWRISFVCNLVTALSFQPFLFGLRAAPEWELLWQPAIVGALFVLGQVFVLVSLSYGEISVAAPVLGLKIIFVPFFLWIFTATALPATIWIACLGATLAVVLLNYSEGKDGAKRVWFSAGCASIGAGAYALFDVCVQMWANQWTSGGFLPFVFYFSTLTSCCFIPFFREPLWKLPRAALPSLGGSAVFFALQAIGIVCAVAYWGQAAAANVVYSSRGLWSLVLVWLVGGFLGASDQGLTNRVFVVRMVGALVLIAAIAVLAQG